MRALRVFLTTVGVVVLGLSALAVLALEWTLRDVPRPAAPRAEPTLAHRGLQCISLSPGQGWLRSALVHPGAEAVARRQALSTKRRTFSRILVEWALSVWLSRHYDDGQLARLDGDSVWLGRGAYGLDEGAQAWFGRGLDQLSLAQSALLVGLAQSPTSLDPRRDPTRALGRRQLVLRAWEGCGLIPSGGADALATTSVLDGVVTQLP